MSRHRPTQAEIEGVLEFYPLHGSARIAPFGNGLINHTYRVDSPTGAYVLQRVNAIFDPSIHHNIEVVTSGLAAAGMVTPRLLANSRGELCTEFPGSGLWRLMTLVEGTSHEVVTDLPQAVEAGRLVGRFHLALRDLADRLRSLRPWVHDTQSHLKTLEKALARGQGHRLYAEAGGMGREILAAARALPPLIPLPLCICHGDLKLNNILFSSTGTETQAICLIDLDTVGPMHLAHELGDAWRSWCCRGGEEAVPADFDLSIFAASLEGYQQGQERLLTGLEKRALLGGVEWISLELAARFAADALNESYFGWDRERFPAAGEHNLARARGQWSLHRLTMENRPERAEILGVSVPVEG